MQAQVEHQQQYADQQVLHSLTAGHPAEVIMGVAAMTAEQIEALQVKQPAEVQAKPEVEIKQSDIDDMVKPDSPPPAIVNTDVKGRPVADDKPGVGGEQGKTLEAAAPAEKAVNPQWAADGTKCAKVFQNADATRKEVVLSLCPVYANQEEPTKDFLKAFRNVLGDTTAASQTASKIKSIFAAYGVPKYERTDGSDPKTKEPIKVTKSGKEWLEGHKAGWESFAALAREIRGPLNPDGTKSGPKQKTSLTDIEATKVVENTKIANAAQAKQIIAAAFDQVLKPLPNSIEHKPGNNKELEIVGFILEMAGALKDSEDLAYRGLGTDIAGMVSDFDNQRAAEEAAFKAANGEVKPVEEKK